MTPPLIKTRTAASYILQTPRSQPAQQRTIELLEILTACQTAASTEPEADPMHCPPCYANW